VKAKSNRSYKNLLFGLLSISAITLTSNILPAQSQIVPDDTLDEESSRVTPDVEINGTPSDRIDGGATRGTNLFHSFSEFNVGEEQGAYFTNPARIENILSRVTGGNPSEILGRLGVTGGDANLFLINPNGIIFGENASLDVGGSFVGTTANGIGLGEEGSFNATEPQTSNLLSVNPSALFFNAVAAQPIINRSQAAGLSGETNSLGEPVGLQVSEGKSLALVGGDVFLEGGNLTTTGGRIELGSVAGVGEVNLNQSGDNLLLGYEGVKTFGNIRLEGTFVDASEGSTRIETANLIASDGGQVFTGTLGEKKGGDLNVNASESIELIGTSTNDEFPGGFSAESEGSGDAGNLTIETDNLIVRNGSRTSTSTLGSGDAGNLTIETDNLIVRDGAQIQAAAFSGGNGGNLNVNASESIEVVGRSTDGQFPSGLFTDTTGSENSGNLTIETDNLIIRDGAQISAGTSGGGNGGDLNVNASKSIEVFGRSMDGQFPSNLSVQTQGNGDAGNLSIETDNLIVFGGQISSGAAGSGDGGDLNVTASESIELVGRLTDGQIPSGLFAGTREDGDAGNLNLSTRQLTIIDGANITNDSSGISKSGDLKLDVSGTLLVDDSDIATNSIQSSGGAINIKAGDIRLRGDGDITTDVSTGTGNGGDINLTADSIVAFDDSDIIAAASDGSGGDINLDTPAFFGDSYQDSSSNTNQNSLDGNNRADINATGEFNGIITIPDVSFIQNNLTNLPQVFLNTNDLIASSCIARRDRQTGSLTITGNDSLPTLSQSDDAAYPTGTVQTIPSLSFDDRNNRPWKKGDPIIEPTGVYRLPNGELVMSHECSQ
jgi:filamentous hemagglutinin family protein